MLLTTLVVRLRSCSCSLHRPASAALARSACSALACTTGLRSPLPFASYAVASTLPLDSALLVQNHVSRKLDFATAPLTSPLLAPSLHPVPSLRRSAVVVMSVVILRLRTLLPTRWLISTQPSPFQPARRG